MEIYSGHKGCEEIDLCEELEPLPSSAIQTLFHQDKLPLCLFCQQAFFEGSHGGPIFSIDELSTQNSWSINNLLKWYEGSQGMSIFEHSTPVAAIDNGHDLGYIHWECFEKHLKKLKEIIR